jgi:hypothetical protein
MFLTINKLKFQRPIRWAGGKFLRIAHAKSLARLGGGVKVRDCSGRGCELKHSRSARSNSCDVRLVRGKLLAALGA